MDTVAITFAVTAPHLRWHRATMKPTKYCSVIGYKICNYCQQDKRANLLKCEIPGQVKEVYMYIFKEFLKYIFIVREF